MIGRHGEADIIIAEFQRELAAANKGLVVPAFIIGIDRCAREPLRAKEDAIAILVRLGEAFIARTAANHAGFRHRQGEIDFHCHHAAAGKRRRQIDAQQRIDHGELQRAARSVGHLQIVEAAFPFLVAHGLAHVGHADLAARRHGFGALCNVIALVILIEQQPQILQRIRAFVVIGDGLAGADGAGGFIQPGGYAVIHLLLPVTMARRAGGVAGVGGGRPILAFQLAELVDEIALGLHDRAGLCRCPQQGERRPHHYPSQHAHLDPVPCSSIVAHCRAGRALASTATASAAFAHRQTRCGGCANVTLRRV